MTRARLCIGAGAIGLLVACASSDGGAGAMGQMADGATAGTTSNAPVPAPLPRGDIAHGKALADKSSCTVCHQADYAGAGFYPNVTPDAQLGIGSWTDTQVDAALRRGLASDGSSLCTLMERFPFSDQEAADVIAYLRSLPPVPKPNGVACPGHGPKPT